MGADEFYNGCFPSGHPDFAEWLAVGMPDCWCYPRQCHGDSDGLMGGSAKTCFYAVGPGDLKILVVASVQTLLTTCLEVPRRDFTVSDPLT
jgi:hypothetical protein